MRPKRTLNIGGINEIWRDENSWKAWRKIAKAPGAKRGIAEVSVYRSEKAEKPF